MNYYNDNCPKSCAWLAELIAAGEGATGPSGESGRSGVHGGLANAPGPRCIGPLRDAESEARDETRVLVSGEHGEDGDGTGEWTAGPAGLGFWDDYELIPCADGKARRIESGLQPLAHGVSGRVGLLRGAGNAIVPQVAAAFIKAVMDLKGGDDHAKEAKKEKVRRLLKPLP